MQSSAFMQLLLKYVASYIVSRTDHDSVFFEHVKCSCMYSYTRSTHVVIYISEQLSFRLHMHTTIQQIATCIAIHPEPTDIALGLHIHSCKCAYIYVASY